MEIQKITVDKLKVAKYNPRRDLKPGDSEFEKLKRSIEEFGYVEPVIWNKRTGTVVGGHQRLKVMRHLGYKEVDCVVLDIDENKEKALNVALNKISGDWDMPLLGELIKDLSMNGFDVTITGFDMAEIDDYFGDDKNSEVVDDNFDVDKAAESIVTPISKQGDVWQLGRHRLLVGDSTKREQVGAFMAGTKADLLITDPPYNVSYEGVAGTIMNDNMEDTRFRKFLVDALSSASHVMKKGGSFYIWHADSEGYNFRGACHDIGWKVRQCLIWNKSALVMGRQDYQWKHEPCLYGWVPGDSHYWGSDRKQTTILEFAKPTRSELHPTMKPIELFAYQIMNSSKVGDVVLDLFAGSGTTMIACDQINRDAALVEFDEKYADVIVKRYIEKCGKDNVFLLRLDEKYNYSDAENITVKV